MYTIGDLVRAEDFNILGDSTTTPIVTADHLARNGATRIQSISIVSGGTGYVVGDLLTVVGGTLLSAPNNIAAQIKVLSVDGTGAITNAYVSIMGYYSVQPSPNPISVTGGTGSSATFNITSAMTYGIQASVGALAGVGYGDIGYGQTSYPMSDVSASGSIAASNWLALRNNINRIIQHQEGTSGTDLSKIPPTSLTATGQPVAAFESTGRTGTDPYLPYDLNSVINTAYVNRFTANATAMSAIALTGSPITAGSTWINSATLTVMLNFGTPDAARYFFNSGGEIRIAFSQPGATTQATTWQNFYSSRLGTVILRRTSSSNTGAVTAPMSTSIGYNNLTGTLAMWYNGTNQVAPSGVYASADFYLQIRRVVASESSPYNVNVTSPDNGANGNAIVIQAQALDGHGSVIPAGLAMNVAVYKATTFLTGIVTPTLTVTQPWTLT